MREGHASFRIDVRLRKARKIAAILGREIELRGARVLEVGTGAGVIAYDLGRRTGPDGEVFAVDVEDQRKIEEGYRFQRVPDTSLPFDDESFDAVVSNHVIEHVGERRDQLHHLEEIRRVLRPGGRVYLAAPNRWAVREPHYRLPFLSWLPRSLASTWLRLLRRGTFYDCVPRSRRELVGLFRAAGFLHREETFTALEIVRRGEAVRPFARFLLRAPQSFFRLLAPFLPTLVFLLRKDGSGED